MSLPAVEVVKDPSRVTEAAFLHQELQMARHAALARSIRVV